MLQSENLEGVCDNDANLDRVLIIEEVEALIAVFQESSTLTHIEVRNGEKSLRLRRESSGATRVRVAPTGVPPLAVSDLAANVESKRDLVPVGGREPGHAAVVLTAHIVGVFHRRRASPLSVGDLVTEGQVIGQIEAMRLMNDCLAVAGGRVSQLMADDGQPVEYGQALLEIEVE